MRKSNRNKRTTKSRGLARKDADNTPQKALHTGQGRTEQDTKLPLRNIVWRVWGGFWSIVGPLLALFSSYYEMSPKIDVEPGANLDPSRLYATDITIANRGYVPVENVRFSCGIGPGGGTSILNGTLTPPDIRPVVELQAGAAVTRSCNEDLEVTGNQKLAFTVSYEWPLIRWRSDQIVIFAVQKGVNSYFLVRDSLR